MRGGGDGGDDSGGGVGVSGGDGGGGGDGSRPGIFLKYLNYMLFVSMSNKVLVKS